MRSSVLVLVLGACAHAPASSPVPAQVAPTAAAPASTPQAGSSARAGDDDDNEPSKPAEWSGCLFSKTELEAVTHDAVTIAPNGGFVLGLALVERERSSSHSYVTWIGLASEPRPGKAFQIQAMLDDSNRELEGGIETSYEIHGTVHGTGTPSADGSSYEIKLASTQQPHMFDPDSPLAHFTVTVKRTHVAADCVYN